MSIAIGTFDEVSSSACNGGPAVRLEFGFDSNADGVLSASERNDSLTRRMCGLSGAGFIENRSSGTQQANSSIDGTATASRLSLVGPWDGGPIEVLEPGALVPMLQLNSRGNLVATAAQDVSYDNHGYSEIGNRFMWVGPRGALRAGYVGDAGVWDALNMGMNSVAFGDTTRASGDNSAAFGRFTTAANFNTFAAGEGCVASGPVSVALGYNAHTNARQGAFVFGDRSTVDEIRAGVNHSATWRVSGGFRIFTSSNLTTGVTIQSGASVSNWGQSNAVISTSTGAFLSTGGVWTNTSDVNRKRDFEDVAPEALLQRLRNLPVREWSYRDEPDDVRHLGPTAQDFRAAFGLGTSDLAIGTVDADGVALAAAKALTERTDALKSEVTRLEGEKAQLQRRLSDLEARLHRLETKR